MMEYGGCSSTVEHLVVAQKATGSSPVSHPSSATLLTKHRQTVLFSFVKNLNAFHFNLI
jgi:hypothetical protein